MAAEVAADTTYAMRRWSPPAPARGPGWPAAGRPPARPARPSESTDVWFVGFTPQLTTAVWFGYGDPPPGRSRGSAAATGGGAITPGGLQGVHGRRAGRPAGAGVPAAGGHRAARSVPPPADPPADHERPAPTRAPARPDADRAAAGDPTRRPAPTASRAAHRRRTPGRARRRRPARSRPAEPRRRPAVRARRPRRHRARDGRPDDRAAAPAPRRTAAPAAGTRSSPGASAAIGGPPGRHARLGQRRPAGRRSGGWSCSPCSPARSACGRRRPCRVHPWDDEYQYTRACYTDVLALYYAERLDAARGPTWTTRSSTRCVIGGAMALGRRRRRRRPAPCPGQHGRAGAGEPSGARPAATGRGCPSATNARWTAAERGRPGARASTT